MNPMDVLHWIASLIVLSVALTHMEQDDPDTLRAGCSSVGWICLGAGAFCGVMEPFAPGIIGYSKLGMIGVGILAVVNQWKGATRHV